MATSSGVISESFYRTNNRDVADVQMDPLQHFLLCGLDEGRTITALGADM